MKKPELLVTPTDVTLIRPLIEAGADALILGESTFALRLAGEWQRDALKHSIEEIHSLHKKAYVSMNAIYHNESIPRIEDYLHFLKDITPDAIIFGDPAVLLLAKEIVPEIPLHWNTEMTATNWYTCNYWGRKGAKRAVLAREISLEAILEIKRHAQVEIEVQVHGMTCMFQSRRPLLGNYFSYLDKPMEIERSKTSRDMVLFDKERNVRYPIFEDKQGTHIMSPYDMCLIQDLHELVEGGIDVFKIDGILQDPKYLVQVVELYRQAIDMAVENPKDYESNAHLFFEKMKTIGPHNRTYDTGFLYKETVY